MRHPSLAGLVVSLTIAGPSVLVAQPGTRVETAVSAPAPAPAAKSRFTLFNPTPWAQARELSTDRPDMTESPYTVPAGRVQFEIDVVNYTRDVSGVGSARTRTESLALAPVNMKVGLLHNLDIQLVVETFVRDRERVLTANTAASSSRVGEITGRAKLNLWGNDGGKTAFGLMPFVSFVPGALGGRYANAGLIVPLAVDLGGGFGLGTMAEFDLEKNEASGRYHTVFVNSITVGRDLTENVGAYLEFFSAASTESGAGWVRTLNAGMTRGIGSNVQLDLGANIGLSRVADDFNPFLGLSFRF